MALTTTHIKVLQFGLGPIGTMITGILLEKPHCTIVGAVDRDPQKISQDLGDIAHTKPLGVYITDNFEKAIEGKKPDIAIVATSSYLEPLSKTLFELIEKGISIVSTCEELSYPWIKHTELSKKIHHAAMTHHVTVLGTGINPGFIMDYFPLVATALCRKVEKIEITRIQNAAKRRQPFQHKMGIGLPVNDFKEQAREHKIGHIGFTESLHHLASKLGISLDAIHESIEPITDSESEGKATGIHQITRGFSNQRELFHLDFKACLDEENPIDRIHITGNPSFDVTIQGGINGDLSTCALTVNALPKVLQCKPGLMTMSEVGAITYFA